MNISVKSQKSHLRTGLFVGLTLPLFLASCGTPIKVQNHYEVNSEALRKIRGMSIVKDHGRPESGYTDLGIVNGLYCNLDRGPMSTTAEQDAIEQVKINAAILGSDHISTPNCVTSLSTDWANNCYTSVTCKSHALKVSPP